MFTLSAPGPWGAGRGEGVQVGGQGRASMQGLGKPQDRLSLRDWRLALPFGDLAVAMRDERRVPLEDVGVLLWVIARRSRRLPSSLGVLRMLNAIDWRL